MLPDIWGKHMWFSIHFIAQDYPLEPSQDDVISYKNFFENLWKVLPCYKCGVNYKRHLKELPIDQYLESRELLFAWTVELHNIVNAELGKPRMTLDEAKKKYSDPEFNTKMLETQKTITSLINLNNPGYKSNMSNLSNVSNVSNLSKVSAAQIIIAFTLGIGVGALVYWMLVKKKHISKK